MPPPRFIYVDPKFLSYHGFSLVCDHNLAAEAITSQQLQELNNRLQQLLEFSQISSGQPMNQPYRKHTPTRARGGVILPIITCYQKKLPELPTKMCSFTSKHQLHPLSGTPMASPTGQSAPRTASGRTSLHKPAGKDTIPCRKARRNSGKNG